MRKIIAAFDDNSIRMIIFVLGLLSAQHVFSQQMNISYKTYCNDRFGYCIKYPDKLLFPQPEAPNGDGRLFFDKEGNRILIVYGTLNMGIIDDGVPTLEQAYKIELAAYKKQPEIKVTYNVIGKMMYVISGTDKGKIFYRKIIKNKEGFGYALLMYKPSERAVYDIVSEEIFKSFH